MKKSMILVISILLLAVLMGCSPGASIAAKTAPSASAAPAVTPPPSPAPTTQPTATADERKYLIRLNYDSKAIAGNLNGENPVQQIYVLLPPNYYDSDKKYPVVYFFNGFGNMPGGFVGMAKSDLAKAMNADNEFIVVEVDGANKYGGSFLVNSPVTGNWEDYAVTEVVTLIDSQYKTIAEVKGRGTAGFSMGGFAALNLAVRHPDVFCAAYGLCPGLLEDGGLPEAMKTWQGDSQFLLAYGQAFCPMPEIADTLSAKPALDGSVADAAIVKKWESGFGNLSKKIDDYLALGKPLKAIAVEYGESDSYTWIPKGCVAFSKLLDEKGIKHTLKHFSGGHTIGPKFVTESLLPFFAEAFKE